MTSIAVLLDDIRAPAPGFASGDDRAFFGHPKGLAYLAFTEAWERFSFYGMTALLLLHAVGFLYYWPTLLALFSRAAPRGINATMMGMLFLSTFLGSIWMGAVGGWWNSMPHVDFFVLHAALAAGPLIAMLLIARPTKRLLAPRLTEELQ